MTPFLRRFIPVALVILPVLTLLPDSRAQFRAAGQALSFTPPDTVLAGHTFIVGLPDTLNGEFVERYVGKRLPVRSWLVERSFFWKTGPHERGDHSILFYAFRGPEKVDSISVQVVVQ